MKRMITILAVLGLGYLCWIFLNRLMKSEEEYKSRVEELEGDYRDDLEKKLEMLSLERGLPRALHSFINEMKQEFTFQLGYAKCKPSFNHLSSNAHWWRK